jgi:hypothetical protein
MTTKKSKRLRVKIGTEFPLLDDMCKGGLPPGKLTNIFAHTPVVACQYSSALQSILDRVQRGKSDPDGKV